MSAPLGWVRAGAVLPADCGFRLEPVAGDAPADGAGLLRVLAPSEPSEPRARLQMQQACYRAVDGFLPAPPGGVSEDPDALRDGLDRIRGHGQLTLTLARPDRPAPAPAPAASGRAFLRNRSRSRGDARGWRQTVETALNRLAASLPVRDRRIAWRDGAVRLDLLVPAGIEPDLGRRLALTIPEAGLAAPNLGRLAVSGLWAPLAFATRPGGDHD